MYQRGWWHLPSIIIWKEKHLNSNWLSRDIPKNWHFRVSENGWTSNKLKLQWLKEVFESHTRERAMGEAASRDPSQRRLIVNDYGSLIRADFIAHCIENSINLLIILPHYSHLMQPLDIKVFIVFKRVYNGETDAILKLNI